MTYMLSTPKISIPKLGLGTYKLNGVSGVNAITTAINSGYRHIDTAQMYNNEAEVAKAIELSEVNRENLFITTKIWPSNFLRLVDAVQESLKSLETDKLDLLLLHWPGTETERQKALDELNIVLHKGYAANVGVSNFNIAMLQDAQKRAPIVANQVEYHPLLNQAKLLNFMQEQELALIAYAPLAQGKALNDGVIKDIAATYGKTPGQVCLRWLVQQNNVAAIPKSSSAERQNENLDVFDFELTKNEMTAIFDLNESEHLVNASGAPNWD